MGARRLQGYSWWPGRFVRDIEVGRHATLLQLFVDSQFRFDVFCAAGAADISAPGAARFRS